MSQNRGPIATILVAGDNQVARDLLETILRTHGYRVIAAADDAEALAMMKSQPVDLALLDAMMPGEGSFRVCRSAKARKETRRTPIVLMTGSQNGEERVQAIQGGIHAGVDAFMNMACRQEELLARVKSLVRAKRRPDQPESAEQVLRVLAGSIEDQDPYTQGHCSRIARYSVALGAQVGLPAEQLLALRRGGMLHDIGKVAIPQHVLLKPGPLDPRERRLMEAHTVIGEQICAPLKSLRGVLPIIRSHHERQDGTGYPDRLKGDQIPMTARILQTVDIYDALTTDRPYREALTPRKALRIMHAEVERGWWDGALVNVLEGMVKNLRKMLAAPLRATTGRKAALQLTA